ncbi:MAG: hypothetical protein HYY23_09530 [Verrucomicrobia bacterium]|nr:hypothetical protein [Verrucomicrobiota bacterium]
MLNFILSLIEFVEGLIGFFTWWRLWLSVFLSLGPVALIYKFVPNRTVCLWLAIPVVIAGVVVGLVWQHREGEE